MKDKKIVIYGANGYTGKLFAKYLIEKGITLILAGRSDSVKKVAGELNCPFRIFTTEKSGEHLSDLDALVNVAGPFAKTQPGLIEGCLATKTHYLDITGEVPDIERVYSYHEKAVKAGIILIPACGFGVVPTDLAAKMASELIDDPTELTIAFDTKGGVSRGTLKTALKDIFKEGVIVRKSQFEPAKPAMKELEVKMTDHTFKAVYNPWRGDLFMSQHSTGIPNIETFSTFPGFIVSMMKGKLGWLRKLILNHLVNLLPEGPNDKQIQKGKTYIKAIVKNKKGEKAAVEIAGPEAYRFTAISLYKILELVFTKQAKGFKTPSEMDTEWIKELPEVSLTFSKD